MRHGRGRGREGGSKVQGQGRGEGALGMTGRVMGKNWVRRLMQGQEVGRDLRFEGSRH